MVKKLKQNLKMVLIVVFLLLVLITGVMFYGIKNNIFFEIRMNNLEPYMKPSKNLLNLLNDYEMPQYLIQQNSNGKSCLAPYDVGDGVETFGPGVTYKTKEEGIQDINSLLGTNYSLENDCIKIRDLEKLQSTKLDSYSWDVLYHAHEYDLSLNQQKFDGLFLLVYNSPDILDYPQFVNALQENGSKERYIDAADKYYQQFDNYYDNPKTKAKNDGYGEGWHNRVVDSSQIYYSGEYDFQNS